MRQASKSTETGKLLGAEKSGISARTYRSNWSSPAYGKAGDKDVVVFGGGDGRRRGLTFRRAQRLLPSQPGGRTMHDDTAQIRATPVQLVSVTLGNALEFYDFLVFSFFAVPYLACRGRLRELVRWPHLASLAAAMLVSMCWIVLAIATRSPRTASPTRRS